MPHMHHPVQLVKTSLTFSRDGEILGSGYDEVDGAYEINEGRWSAHSPGARVAWIESYQNPPFCREFEGAPFEVWPCAVRCGPMAPSSRFGRQAVALAVRSSFCLLCRLGRTVKPGCGMRSRHARASAKHGYVLTVAPPLAKKRGGFSAELRQLL